MSISQIILQGIQDAGGAASMAYIDRIAQNTFKKQASKRRCVNVELAKLVEQGLLKVCTDGLYRLPQKPRTRDTSSPHIGTTFYTRPEIIDGSNWADRPVIRSRTHRNKD